MEKRIIAEIHSQIANFKLPRYKELPDIELYIDQVVQLIQQILEPLRSDKEQVWITSSMINNYTKQGLIKRPTKKRYNKEHIAYLLYICLAKNVMQIANIKELISTQKMDYESEIAYNFFCDTFENALQKVFNNTEPQPLNVTEMTAPVFLLSATVDTITQQIYLNKYLGLLSKEKLQDTEKPNKK